MRLLKHGEGDDLNYTIVGITPVDLATLVAAKPPLTLNQASLLGELINGVQRNLNISFYPNGSDSADNPMKAVLRAFTRDGGGLYLDDGDVRDAYVWTSGFSERWFKVDDLLKAMDNIDGKHGFSAPIAVIES